MSKPVALKLSKGESVFDFMRARLKLIKPGKICFQPPQLVIAPIKKGYLTVDEPCFELQPDVAEQIRAGRAVLAIDCAREGMPHHRTRSESLHAYLSRYGFSPELCVYITQDRSYRKAYERFCRRKGWRPAKVLNHDYFIRLLFEMPVEKGAALYKARLEAFRQRPPRRERRFICMNFSPRWNKVMFLLQLMDDGLWEQGFISFGGFGLRGQREVQCEKMRRLLMAAQGFEDIAPRLTQAHLDRLDQDGQILLERLPRTRSDPDAGNVPWLDFDIEEHDRSWFTVVTETEILGPRRITEKPFKALLGFHPFVLLGNRGSLALIRQLGFQTFGGWIDESYDDEIDPRRRFDMVMSEVRRLCSLDEAELRRMEREMKPVLAHNARWGLTQLPAIYREKTDPAFLAEVLSLLQPASASAA